MNFSRTLVMAFWVLLLFSCKKESNWQEDHTVRLRLASEPDRLHPLISGTAPSQQVELHLFAPLLQFDPQSLELAPVLANSLPQIDSITNGTYRGGMTYTFEIRPEARWDNGDPILASDYVFTVKALFHPKVAAAAYRSYLNFLKDIVIDPDNPRRFTIITDRPYIMAEGALGNMNVYPAYAYDPEGILSNYTIPQLTNLEQAEELVQQDILLRQFAETFSSNERSRNPEQISGAGAYALEEWLPGERIVLKKKENWWGEPFSTKETLLQAHPEKLIFHIIPDAATAVSLLKAQQLDAMTEIPPNHYHDLQKEEKLVESYHFFNPYKLSYYYIGLNGNDPRLEDRRVRRSLAHLLDVDQIIETLLNGLGERVNGPIHPIKSYYHQELLPIPFDLIKAGDLLKAAGWSDSNGDGIVDRQIDGQVVELELTFKYSANNVAAANVGLLLKNNARKVGVDIKLEAKVLKELFGDFRKRDFELIYLRWLRPPGLDDLRQGWHTSGNVAGGSNRTGFGDATSDEIIDRIRVSYDPTERKELYLSIQEIIYREQPYLFLYAPLECMAIHNRFNAKPSVRHPGIFPNEFAQKKKDY